MSTIKSQQFQRGIVDMLVNAGKIDHAELSRYHAGSIAYRNDFGRAYLGIRVPNAKPGQPKIVQYWKRISRGLGFGSLSHAVYLSSRDSETLLAETRAECPELYKHIMNR